MIPYRVTIKIIRNSNFKKHNTLLKNFLKIINSTYKDLYYALNNNLNCITMNDKSEISDNQIIYAKYLGIDIIDEQFEIIKKFDQYYSEKHFNEENNKLILKYII